MKLTVIGAGNGGVTASYHFSRIGHDVCIYDQPEYAVQIEAIQRTGKIVAIDQMHGENMILSGEAAVHLATTDISKAVSFADVLVMIVPSFAHEIIFEKMLPYLRDGQTVITMPGNYASLVFQRMMKERERSIDLTFVDMISIPWACRIFEPGQIGVMGIKKLIYGGVLPKSRTDQTMQVMNDAFPIPVVPLGSVIEAGLENINFGGHPLITTLNMGLLENFNGQFNYYADCFSPALDRAAKKMEDERQSIGDGLGISLREELDMMNTLYGAQAKTVYEFNKTSVAHAKIHSAPSHPSSRYISEDVPNILVPCYEFAMRLNLAVPIIESCIRISSAYNDTDYFKTGRTLEKMGLAEFTLEEILEYVGA